MYYWPLTAHGARQVRDPTEVVPFQFSDKGTEAWRSDEIWGRPWGRRHSDARNSGHTPACTIPTASTTPAQPTSSQSQCETPETVI